MRIDRTAVGIVGVLLLLTLGLVGLSLRREPPPGYAVTDTAPVEVGPRLHGPARVTVDASEGWVYFSFRRAATVDSPGPLDWDIAFRRFHVMVNGGPGFAGSGGVANLGEVGFESVVAAPDTGWVDEVARDSTNRAIARWYDYGFTSHLLSPKPRVYALRTADGRFAKLRFLSYYCHGARPGCVTFEYVYQGDGTRTLAPATQSSPTRPEEAPAIPALTGSAR